MRHIALIAMLGMAGCKGPAIDIPDPMPTPTPVGERFVNEAVGLIVRLKDYPAQPNRTYKGRRTVVKASEKFKSKFGMTEANMTVEVDGKNMTFYGYDSESGDLCFYDETRFPEDYAKPFYIEIRRGGVLHTVLKVDEWDYKAVTVQAECELPAKQRERR